MKLKSGLPFVLGLVLFTACNQKPDTTEKVEIQTMDSTEQVVKTETEKLEDQTKKVEASLDKLEKEFPEEKNQ